MEEKTKLKYAFYAVVVVIGILLGLTVYSLTHPAPRLASDDEKLQQCFQCFEENNLSRDDYGSDEDFRFAVGGKCKFCEWAVAELEV